MILRHPGWTPEALPPLELDENDIEMLGDDLIKGVNCYAVFFVNRIADIHIQIAWPTTFRICPRNFSPILGNASKN